MPAGYEMEAPAEDLDSMLSRESPTLSLEYEVGHTIKPQYVHSSKEINVSDAPPLYNNETKSVQRRPACLIVL